MITEKILVFLSKYFNVNEIEEDTNFIEEGLVNSLFFMQLILFIEEEFDLSITNNNIEIGNFSSIKNIVNFIENTLVINEK